MNCKLVKFSGHAVSQMFQRRISKDEVHDLINECQVIKDYPDDRPYPSKLLLGFPKGRPLHVVLAYDSAHETCIIVTTYEPNPDLWDENYKSRR